MTKREYEEEFFEKIKEKYFEQSELSWHQYVEANIPKLSKQALNYICQNNDNCFFGDWMVRAASNIIFEDIVLKVQND